LIGVLAGCTSVRSELEVTGVYGLYADSQKITLEVFTDGTFTETIVFAPRHVEKRVGRWRWAQGRMSFDVLWIPESFAPDYIRRADSRSDGGQQKYSDPGHWSIMAEKHWGTIILPIFPDADTHFTMVQHSSAR
jgi:hypothetical protein